MSKFIDVLNWHPVSFIRTYSVSQLVAMVSLAAICVKLPFLEFDEHALWGKICSFKVDRGDSVFDVAFIDVKSNARLCVL